MIYIPRSFQESNLSLYNNFTDWLNLTKETSAGSGLYLIDLSLDKMAAILQTTFSDAFSWMKKKVCILIKISLTFVPKGQIRLMKFKRNIICKTHIPKRCKVQWS